MLNYGMVVNLKAIFIFFILFELTMSVISTTAASASSLAILASEISCTIEE